MLYKMTLRVTLEQNIVVDAADASEASHRGLATIEQLEPVVGWSVSNEQAAQVVNVTSMSGLVPVSESLALDRVAPAMLMDDHDLEHVDDARIERMWAAVCYLLPALHPDDIEHSDYVDIPDLTPAEFREKFSSGDLELQESGWPLCLLPLAAEAQRRYERGSMPDGLYYPVEAQKAGFARFRTAVR